MTKENLPKEKVVKELEEELENLGYTVVFEPEYTLCLTIWNPSSLSGTISKTALEIVEEYGFRLNSIYESKYYSGKFVACFAWKGGSE